MTLLVIVVAAICSDSLISIAILNRVTQTRSEVCDIHAKVRAWELGASEQLRIREPLLGPPPGYCR